MTNPAAGGSPEPGWEPSSAELARRADPQVGTAYAVSVRTESEQYNRIRNETILTFRLRRTDPTGRELPPVAVEMRGPTLNGMIAEGDLIRLPQPLPHGGALQLTSVANLTTNSAVTTAARGGLPKAVQIGLLTVFGIIFLFVVLGVIAAMVSMAQF